MNNRRTVGAGTERVRGGCRKAGVLISFVETGGCVMCKMMTYSVLVRVWPIFWLFLHRNGKFCAFSVLLVVFCRGAAAG